MKLRQQLEAARLDGRLQEPRFAALGFTQWLCLVPG